MRITKPFYLGVYAVTQEEYERVTGNNPSWFSRGGAEKDAVAGLDTRRFPVENVSWHDAVEFCRRLSELPGEKAAGHVYRLPTEAQWEHACRAGATTRFSFGNECNGRQANCDGRYPCGTLEKGPHLGRTAQVGSYPANVFGLYDMHGNVWQLCEDWYDGGYYAGLPMDNPAGPTFGLHRVVRGGGWFHGAGDCRSANRGHNAPGDRGHYLGFRVSLTLTAKVPNGEKDAKPRVSKGEKSPANAQAATSPKEVDLLKLVDPAKDAVRGDWSFANGSLVCEPWPYTQIGVLTNHPMNTIIASCSFLTSAARPWD